MYFLTDLNAFLLSILAIGLWKVFEKMGVPCWKALIPFYNEFVLFERVWKPVCFGYLFILLLVFYGARNTYDSHDMGHEYYILMIIFTFGIALLIRGFVKLAIAGSFCGILIILYKRNLRLARAFGYNIKFALGLTFLPPVFFLLLGIGNAEFQPPFSVESVNEHSAEIQLPTENELPEDSDIHT